MAKKWQARIEKYNELVNRHNVLRESRQARALTPPTHACFARY